MSHNLDVVGEAKSLESSIIPPAGLLSGMILTITSAFFWILAPLFSDALIERFRQPLSQGLYFWFAISCVVMGLHKLESYIAGEFDQCPVYLYQGTLPLARDPRRLNFVVFVGTFLAMLLLCVLLMYGMPWPRILIGIWVGQGLHELHHSAKSVQRKLFYPGVFTSILFVWIMGARVFPLWWTSSFPEYSQFTAYYPVLAAVIWGAFFREDRLWIRRLGYIPRARRTSSGSSSGSRSFQAPEAVQE